MDRDEFVERVADGGAFQSKREVEAAAKATLGALGAVLSPDERSRVSEDLPQTLRQWLGPSEPGMATDPETFFARVGQAEGVRAGARQPAPPQYDSSRPSPLRERGKER